MIEKYAFFLVIGIGIGMLIATICVFIDTKPWRR